MDMKTFSYGRHLIDDDDVRAVTNVLRSERLTQGALVAEFEAALAAYTGARFACVVSSGTAALHLAYLAIGLKPGETILTTTNTFASTANAALLAGGLVSFSDIDPTTYNMTTVSAGNATYKGPFKAIVPVDFAGLPVDIESIKALAGRSGGGIVIRDACHALGATFVDSGGVTRKVGSSAYADMTVFSFHPVKAITTGEGGAITTNDKALYKRLKLLCTHGITREAGSFKEADIASTEKPGPWYYEMHELGLNYRITDFQCALGISQLKKLDRFIERRAQLAAIYDGFFEGTVVKRNVSADKKTSSAHHLYVVQIDFEHLKIDKGAWFKDMADNGILLQVHYIPVHLQPFYRERLGSSIGSLPCAERYYKQAVSLPLHPGLSDDEVKQVASKVVESLINWKN